MILDGLPGGADLVRSSERKPRGILNEMVTDAPAASFTLEGLRDLMERTWIERRPLRAICEDWRVPGGLALRQWDTRGDCVIWVNPLSLAFVERVPATPSSLIQGVPVYPHGSH